ncbi:MAG: hypothetical protein V1647_06715, partial [Pseudomonadota bacterium]
GVSKEWQNYGWFEPKYLVKKETYENGKTQSRIEKQYDEDRQLVQVIKYDETGKAEKQYKPGFLYKIIMR